MELKRKPVRIAVVGGGIIGLSTVRELLEYFDNSAEFGRVCIDLYADKLGTDFDSTSFGAGGLFRVPSEAHKAASPGTNKLWQASFEYFCSLASASRGAAPEAYGVFRAPAYYVTRNAEEDIDDRIWGDLAASFYPDFKIIYGSLAARPTEESQQDVAVELPHIRLPAFAKGVFHYALIVDAVVYMKRLLTEFRKFQNNDSGNDLVDGALDQVEDLVKPTNQPRLVTLNLYHAVHIDDLLTLAMCSNPKQTAAKNTDLREKEYSSFADAYDIVINCSALGSYELANDHTVFPVRGQMVRFNAPVLSAFAEDHVLMMFTNSNASEKESSVDYDSDADDNAVKAEYYVIPQAGRCRIACGGIRQRNCWSVQISPAQTRHISQLCRINYHNDGFDWDRAELVEEWAGLRPFREGGVRIEAEWCVIPVHDSAGSEMLQKKVCIIHNYGHGASGIVLSYGSARRVVELVRDAIERGVE